MEIDKWHDNPITLGEEDVFDIIPQGENKFESAEHDALARATKLKWPGGVSAFANDKRYPVKCVKFNPTRLTIRNIPEYHYLTFNEIVPLAGDFFTTKDYQPIAYGLEPGKGDEKAGEWYEPKITMRGRFEQSVKNLAEDQDGTLFWCIENIDSDMSTVEHAQHEHKHESHVYFAGGVDRSHKITGTSYWMWSIGHSVALDWAEKGTERGPDGTPRSACERLNALQEAYKHEAFAAHYLTDLFSSGHLRAPRRELHKSGEEFKQLTGKLLGWLPFFGDTSYVGFSAEVWDMQVNKMHESDGASGLTVTNAKGDSWTAYGDKQFFSPYNRVNRLRSIEACQAGVDEIFAVWDGKKKKPTPVFASAKKQQEMYEAIKLAPMVGDYNIDEDGPWTGNPCRLWSISLRSHTTPFTLKDEEVAVKKGLFQRREVLNDCDNYKMRQNANPGWSGITKNQASTDCQEIILDSTWINHEPAYPEVPMCEIVMGGFIQITEFKDRYMPDEKFDHAMNVWGPAKFQCPGESDAKPTMMLRKRYPTLAFPSGLGRITGDQKTLKWLNGRSLSNQNETMRIYYSLRNKTVGIYSIGWSCQVPDFQVQTNMTPGRTQFSEAEVSSRYQSERAFWPGEINVREWPSMRFFNFNSMSVDKDRYNEAVGFKASKGPNGLQYDIGYQVHPKFPQDWSLSTVTVTDDAGGLALPDFIKPYATYDASDNRLLVIRRIGATGTTGTKMDVEVRSYRRSLINKRKDTGKPHPCISVHKITLNAPDNAAVNAPDGFQVLVDDMRNCGRPELVFMIGIANNSYSVQVFGFDDNNNLNQTIKDAAPALPAEVPLSGYTFRNSHFTGFCPNEKIPWVHDIVQVSRIDNVGLGLGEPDRYLNFRTWIKGEQLAPPGGIPKQFKDRPELFEMHWFRKTLDNEKTVIPKSAPAVGWGKVVDGYVKDEIGRFPGYFSIKWGRAAVKVPVDSKKPDGDKVLTTRGIMEVFSYYGVLGFRVFAPRMEKRDYSGWQLVCQVPFMGQTSRGTGQTLGGNWNADSLHSWGYSSSDFGDVNLWHRKGKDWKTFHGDDEYKDLVHGFDFSSHPLYPMK